MKVSVKKLPQSQVELTITIPYDMYLEAEKQVIQDLSKEMKVDGFRSGHIPEDVVREKVGEEGIRVYSMEKVLPLAYAKAIKEEDVQVIAQPKVDIKTPIKKEGDELVFTAIVAVMPEVKMGDWKKIKVKKEKAKVEKKQVDETIDMIMDRFAEWQDVKRKAKKGDRVEIDFEGFDEKGKAIENTASKNHPVILGTNTMIPGFENAVVGMEVGDKKEFDITFPKDYHAKFMQGKKVKFKLSLGRLEEKKEQKLDEAMIEKVTGQKQSVEDFKKRVEEDLTKEMEQRLQSQHDNKVVEEIIKITKADLPEELIEQELHQMMDEQKRRIQQQGLQWDQYLQHVNKTEEDFKKDHQKAAEDRLRARLGVHTILKESKIEVEDKEVDEKIKDMVARYPKEQQDQVKAHYGKDTEGYRNIKNNMAADKLIEMLTA